MWVIVILGFSAALLLVFQVTLETNSLEQNIRRLIEGIYRHYENGHSKSKETDTSADS